MKKKTITFLSVSISISFIFLNIATAGQLDQKGAKPQKNIHHNSNNTSLIKKLKKELPVVRDPVSSCYLRQEGKGLLIGIYEKNAKCWALGGMDWKFNMELLEPELDRLEEHLDK